MLELLKFPYEVGRAFDITLDAKILLEIVTKIEGKVYDKNFNVTTSINKGNSIYKFIFSCLNRSR